MKAYQIQGTEGLASLRIAELPSPEPQHGQVRVRLRAVSLNYRDYMNVMGIRGVTGPIPRIPCSDGAGEVVAVGPGVNEWAIGDRVVCPFMPSWLNGGFTRLHLTTHHEGIPCRDRSARQCGGFFETQMLRNAQQAGCRQTRLLAQQSIHSTTERLSGMNLSKATIQP